MFYGWMGTVLRIDLSTAKINYETLDKGVAHKLLVGVELTGTLYIMKLITILIL